MKFVRSDPDPSESRRIPSVCYLVKDNWDDFTFKTTFVAVLFDDDGIPHRLGGVKILKRGLESGRVPLPDRFTELDDQWVFPGHG
jgi:hypothetical protein